MRWQIGDQKKRMKMGAIRQSLAIVIMSLRSIPDRVGSSFVAIVGIAGVVAVLLGMLTLSGSLSRTLESNSRADRAIILSKGARFENVSSLQRDVVESVLQVPGISKDSGGDLIASPEVLAFVPLRKRSDGTRESVTVRGVAKIAFELRPEVTMVAGRMPKAGLDELMVGRAITMRYKGLEVGSKLSIGAAPWTVVGEFEDGGSVHESELITDAETLLSAFQRTTFQSVAVKLESAENFAKFKADLAANPAASVDVVSERVYARRQSESFAKLFETVAYVVGLIMAMAATFGALNTMYTVVSDRGIEIGTLRALGFAPTGVVVSILFESLLLAAVGATCGGLLVALLLNGDSFHTGPVTARLHVSIHTFVVAIVWAGVVGLLGGLFPAIRAARMPIIEALHKY